ncbi:hypothetical protein BFL38_10970 [Brachyspira hampsonii]|uniref:Short-chain dehydrogenase n=1 Tax=Brachyspira hampsonii TaxID=1287055 RepID=A0A1E5NII0_9SPIR|nr:SDR family NAD(P)-dependent oxidoreductase [Brachyspira hampsonii]OEJ15971.1 hypothetical protein BFL38_10970 [Brachyspira hampsonii]
MKNVVFITGGNRGIGLELCKKFAIEYNFKVYMGARDLNKAKEAIKYLSSPSNIIPIEIDVEFEKSIEEAYQEYLKIKDKDEKIYIFINNAGIRLDWFPPNEHIKTLDLKSDDIIRMYKVNTIASILTTKYFINEIEKGGRIVNVSSGNSEFWQPYTEEDVNVGYASSKVALNMITKKLSGAVKDRNIFVNCVCPGWCKTDMGSEFAPTTAEDGANSIIQACFLNEENPPTGKYFRYGEIIPIDVYPTFNNNEGVYMQQLEKIKENINKLAWWIPIRKWRDNFRNKMLNTDQTRPDQTRPDQTRPDPSM